MPRAAAPSRAAAPADADGRKLTRLDYLQKILTARVYDVAIESELTLARNLSARLGHQVWLKREDTQPVFSFKLRGAYNKMAQLSPAQHRVHPGPLCPPMIPVSVFTRPR